MAKIKKKDPHASREAQKYENPIPSREYIIEYLEERGRPATYPQLQEELELMDEDRAEALRRRLIAMTRDGQLMKNRKGAFGLLEKMEVIAGRVIGHKDGFGFVEPDIKSEDLFLSPRQMRSVFHGDRVLVRVSDIDTRGRREAMVVEVLEHNTQQLVGRLYVKSGAAYVEPVNQRINQSILIAPEKLHGATDGQMVVTAILVHPGPRLRPVGEVVEVLGDHMAPGLEITVAIRNHELPTEWPTDAALEASQFSPTVLETSFADRVDLRSLPFVTIDGEDAKDFDDAVYCVPREKGGWLLSVAIADVSHYVSPNSALDREAYNRGNSVYFPGRVIPMLPETLSNHLCSLNPNVDRLVMVCEMEIHPAGRIVKYEFKEAVIRSSARLTYNQVYLMMEKKDKRMQERFKTIVPQLAHLYDLFAILQEARHSRGAIDFDMPETKIIFGKDRKIEKIVAYERFNSHRVIEECMLCANISAARFLSKNKQPSLYRVHQGPTEQKLNDLRRFLQEMGLKMPSQKEPTPADYAHILHEAKDRPDARMIQTVLLRSMSQAIYHPENKGHFGLAYEAYTHFTSPIRRYPDLLVHRAIKHALAKKSFQDDLALLTKAAEHCSKRERRADEATSEVTDWLKCEFMMDKIGQTFSGIITGVTSFGVFVELAEVFVEGLIHISNLPSDYYQFDPIKHTLQGDKSKRRFRLGDGLKIIVARVDLDQGEIDFELAEKMQKQTAEKPEKRKRSHLHKNKKKKQGKKNDTKQI